MTVPSRMDLTHHRRQLAKLSKKDQTRDWPKKFLGRPLRRPRGNEYRGAADLRCRGFTPGPNLEPESESGLSHQPLQHSLHLERGPRALAPRSRYSLASSPAAICLNDVAPFTCSSAFGGVYRRPRCRTLLAARSGLYAHLHGWLDATVTAQLRTARLGGGDRRLRTHAEHVRCPRRAVEP
jgi:hypothetical protein